jgi:hypothetical protein
MQDLSWSDPFDEENAAHLAAYLLHLAGGGMSAESLLRMLYLVDRESYRESGNPATWDLAVLSERGPVPSATRDIMMGIRKSKCWSRFVSPVVNGRVSLIADAGEPEVDFFGDMEIDDGPSELDQLCGKDGDAAEQVFAKYGHMDHWAYEDLAREFPEMRCAAGLGEAIPVPAIFLAVGVEPNDVPLWMDQLDESHGLKTCFNYQGPEATDEECLAFREEKRAQFAAYFLDKAGGGMRVDKLMRLMYLAERGSLLEYHEPIVSDQIILSGAGPALAATLDLALGAWQSEPWSRLMSPVEDGAIALVGNVGEHEIYSVPTLGGGWAETDLGPALLDRLMGQDKYIADTVFAKYGHKETWTDEDLRREFPEALDARPPRGAIPLASILLTLGKDPDVVPIIVGNIIESRTWSVWS